MAVKEDDGGGSIVTFFKMVLPLRIVRGALRQNSQLGYFARLG